MTDKNDELIEALRANALDECDEAAARILADAEVIEAARELDSAARFYKDFVLDHTGNSEVVPVFTDALARLDLALTAFREAMKKREDTSND